MSAKPGKSRIAQEHRAPEPGDVPHYAADGKLRHWCRAERCPDLERRADAEARTSFRVDMQQHRAQPLTLQELYGHSSVLRDLCEKTPSCGECRGCESAEYLYRAAAEIADRDARLEAVISVLDAPLNIAGDPNPIALTSVYGERLVKAKAAAKGEKLMTNTNDAHSPQCECRECLGVDYDRYHALTARDERERDGDYD